MLFMKRKKAEGWFARIMRRVFVAPVEPRALLMRIFYLNIYVNIQAWLRRSREFSDLALLSGGDISQADRVVVIACHKPTPDFAIIVQALRANGYAIVAYVYAKADAERFFTPADMVYLRTESFGRDFYAYKHAGLHVLPMVKNEAPVMFLNDSCFFVEGIEKVIEWFAAERATPWCTFSVNLRKHFHAGSYMIQVSGRAREAVRSFLADYFPRNTRFHAIHFGETMLSYHLINAGFAPRAWMWEHDVVGRLADMIVGETEFTGAKHNLLSDIVNLSLLNGYETSSVLENDARFKSEMIRYAEDDNVLNRLGLYLFDYGLVPLLKKDVFYRNKGINLIRYKTHRPELRSLEYLSVLYARERYMSSFPNTFRGRQRKMIAQIDD